MLKPAPVQLGAFFIFTREWEIPMRNFIQPGQVLTMVATVAVASGSLIKEGVIIGVASTSAEAGDEYELRVGGVYEMPKVAAESWAVGDAIYSDANGVLSTSDAGNTKVGAAVKVADAGSGTGFVRLNDSF